MGQFLFMMLAIYLQSQIKIKTRTFLQQETLFVIIEETWYCTKVLPYFLQMTKKTLCWLQLMDAPATKEAITTLPTQLTTVAVSSREPHGYLQKNRTALQVFSLTSMNVCATGHLRWHVQLIALILQPLQDHNVSIQYCLAFFLLFISMPKFGFIDLQSFLVPVLWKAYIFVFCDLLQNRSVKKIRACWCFHLSNSLVWCHFYKQI